MHVYRLAHIHLHHHHSEDRIFIHNRFVRQICLSRHMLVYSMRLIRIVLKREIKSKGMNMTHTIMSYQSYEWKNRRPR